MTTDPQVRDARRGLVLFACYLALYAGFVVVAVAAPAAMAWRPFGGANLAVWYGMTLIVAPLVLAAIYLVWLTRGNDPGQGTKGAA